VLKRKIRGIYRRGDVFWLAKQVNGRRTFITLETGDYVEAVKRAPNVFIIGVNECKPIVAVMNQNNRCGHRTGIFGNTRKPNAAMSGTDRNAAVNQSSLPFAPIHIALQRSKITPIA
jgi:hypothetical protein